MTTLEWLTNVWVAVCTVFGAGILAATIMMAIDDNKRSKNSKKERKIKMYITKYIQVSLNDKTLKDLEAVKRDMEELQNDADLNFDMKDKYFNQLSEMAEYVLCAIADLERYIDNENENIRLKNN